MIGFISTWYSQLLLTSNSAIDDSHNFQFIVKQALWFSAFFSRVLVTKLKSLTVTKSSNHTPNLHKPTSNFSWTTSPNFPWAYRTDNWLPYIVAERTRKHRQHMSRVIICFHWARYQHWAWRGPHRDDLFCCQNACSLVHCPALCVARAT
jgi:hypothetical protein